ncbi:Multi antimicrobial extrusion protein [Dioscorea alata]|uniref:Multi antimicrobial extrusion protein n=4 Tax=Dioscorea alata TaxID=55571 RepID=A0ACB7UXD2_DIOAL|nr:Multi antimicrobial extrusion protein [Dioscorea alata]KAH7665562.1 Multi antimicrobial extrusion protein [Dioscorea alata]KAH7665563.1 Multi antimicrobial extrusion protein [Dioscorea alata]KAH7665564.1 Multi antimicrobial extrusion protein [Dioscorea alata]
MDSKPTENGKEMAVINPAEDTKHTQPEDENHLSDDPENGTNLDETTDQDCPSPLKSAFRRKSGLHIFFMDIRNVLKLDEIGLEIARIAVPAALALAADPLASLVDTAFIGRLGPVEIAAVGVSIAIFNQVSKVAIYPLVSVTTSFVAEEDAICNEITVKEENKDLEKAAAPNSETKVLPVPNDSEKTGCYSSCFSSKCTNSFGTGRERRYIPSVSSALVVGGVLGLIQAIFLILAAKLVLNIMGVKSGSPMLAPACRYLTLRSLGAPAVLLSLAMQGVFRGFKDTKTPLYATVAGDLANIILDPILIFVFRMGVSGAAIAHVFSQYLITFILLCKLVKQVDVVPPSLKALQFSRFLRCGFLLLARVIAVTFCVTLAASLAAHHGPIPMAAFQISLQLWLATSLLSDGLAVAGQAIIASSFAKGDYNKVVAATSRVLQLSVVVGIALAVLLGVGMEFGSGIFTKDKEVIKLIHKGLPFVAATQPINSLAFVFDGVNFGASDYTYSAYSMVMVAIISIPSLIFLSSSSYAYIGIWTALTIYMSLRTFAGVWRMGAARGPWTFLRRGSSSQR